MKRTVPILVGALLLLGLVLFNTTYAVNFHEVAIKTRFGKALGVERSAGLHLKAPFFIDRVSTLDNRLQLVDSPLVTVGTKDGQQVMAQCYLLWRLGSRDEDVLGFFETLRTIEEANKSLEELVQTAIRVIGSFDFDELVGESNRLGEAEAKVFDELRRSLPRGIDAVSVGLTQVTLPAKQAQAVIRRMEATQKRLGETERSRGNAEAQLITAQAANAADKIRAFAEERAKAIEAEGTREAAKYLEQMSEAQDLAIFLAWCDALRAAAGGQATIVLDSTMAPMHLLNLDAPIDANGIPQPERLRAPRPGAVTVPSAGGAATPSRPRPAQGSSEGPAKGSGEDDR